MKKIFRRILALACACALLLTAASALTVEQALELLEQHYINEIPEEAYSAESLDELFTRLGDPYTYYMEPKEYDDFVAAVEGTTKTVGIGVQVLFTARGIEVAGVINGGPAEESGLVVGDYIIAVDGVSCVPAIDSMADLIRGEEGTDVTVTVLHKDGSVEDYCLTRRHLVIGNTNISVLDGRFGWISCTSFGSDTANVIRNGIQKHDSAVDTWILDLRSNSGGLGDTAVLMVGYFAGAGPHLNLRDAQDINWLTVYASSRLTTDPVIVLTDHLSASAAELVPADLRDCQAGISIGQRTFGKGTAQINLTKENAPEYFEDDSMKVSAYRFFSTEKNTMDMIGVIPTILLENADSRKAAMLLSGAEPEDSAGWIAIRLGGVGWYVNLEKVQSEEYRDTFNALLEALPPETKTFIGLGGNIWENVPLEYIFSVYGNEVRTRWFNDIEDSAYRNELNTLATYRILHGMEDGVFRPNEVMTRAQLCAMLAQTFNITTNAPSEFSDVDNNAWYADDVMAMYITGYMDGFEDGTFRPNAPVTNEELIRVLGKLAAFLNADLYDIVNGIKEEDFDSELIAAFSEEAKEAAWLMVTLQNSGEDNTGILYDAIENLDLSAPVLREQAGASLCKLLTYTGIISD